MVSSILVRCMTACLHSGTEVDNLNVVIMFVREYEFPNWSLLSSRLMFLESPLPVPPTARKSISRWSHDLFTEAIERTNSQDALANIANPIEYIIPYAQMILINATFVVDMWAMKVMHPQGKTPSNLEVHYDKQVGILNEIRMNLDTLRVFTTTESSLRWKNMIMDFERVLRSTEQQINVVLAQKMTYRAAMASLDESRMGIEHSKRSIEQNARVKRLTQLALVFIPLSFSTSVFGMNLEMLGTGNAKAWMVLITVMSAYVVTSLLWVLIDYQNIKAACSAGKSRLRWPISDLSIENEKGSKLPAA